MDYNTPENLAACYVIVQDASRLLFYSHIPTAISALIIGIFVLFKGRGSLLSRLLFSITVVFASWSFLDLALWLNYDKNTLLMFIWSFFGILYLLIYILSLYFVYVFINKDDISFFKKVLIFFPILPLILLAPTKYNLEAYNIVDCIAVENTYYTNYYYASGLVIFFVILIISFFHYRKAQKEHKKQILFLALGVGLFLLSFFITGFLASYLIDNGYIAGGDYSMEQYGLFGMPIFMGFLAYLIVKFKAFDIKLIGAQALVVTQFILIGSILTIVTSTVNYVLVSITLVMTLIAGWVLIRSVRKEIERKEELQKISDSLAIANARLKELDTAKSEFISIASHQLRTPLTAIKGYVSLLLEGSYGQVPAAIQDVLNKIYSVNSRLVQLVEDLLNVSRIEAGRIQYNFQPTHIEPIIAELVDMFAVTAKDRHLELKMQLAKKPLPEMTIDPNKIKEVVSNLIDNALKYTKEGGVTVSVEADERAARIIVSDTGIGIKPEDSDKLFDKFIRTKETTKLFVSGTGLGLYVGKNFVEAHGGKIWSESDGEGKGSRFIIELPFVNPKIHIGTSDQASFSGQGK